MDGCDGSVYTRCVVLDMWLGPVGAGSCKCLLDLDALDVTMHKIEIYTIYMPYINPERLVLARHIRGFVEEPPIICVFTMYSVYSQYMYGR